MFKKIETEKEKGAPVAEKTVRDIMETKVITLGRNDSLDIVKDIMTQDRIRHFPVVEEGQLVGVVSQRDLFHASLGSVMKYGEKAQRAYLATIRAKEVMSHPPTTISPDAPIKEAARQMVEKKIGCLPVVEAEKLVGLVTETDILRDVAEMP